MRLPRGIALFVCTLGLAALSLPAAASAAPVSTVKVAKQHGGPFVDDDIAANVTNRKNLYMRAINEVSTPQEWVLTEDSGGIGEPDYQVKWFKGNKNVSHDVRNSGHEFTVKPDQPKTFRVQVKPDVANPDPFCLVGAFLNTTNSFLLHGIIAINDQSACV